MRSFQGRTREVEEKIAVAMEAERYFIVDCPSMHLIPAAYLDTRRTQMSEAGLSLPAELPCHQRLTLFPGTVVLRRGLLPAMPADHHQVAPDPVGVLRWRRFCHSVSDQPGQRRGPDVLAITGPNTGSVARTGGRRRVWQPCWRWPEAARQRPGRLHHVDPVQLIGVAAAAERAAGRDRGRAHPGVPAVQP